MEKKKAVRRRTAFFVILFLFVTLLWRTFQFYKVEGISMQPTLQPGQGLLLIRIPWLAGGIHDGDIVIVSDPSGQQRFIKRVYKSAGEVVEPGLQPEGIDNGSDYTVPAGNVYVLGDNRDQSEDSRAWGPVPLDRVEGKAVFAPGVVK